MLSVETYLSIINYEGIGATGAPIIGDVFTWTQEPIEVGGTAVVPSAGDEGRKRKKRHWSQKYQREFSKWLSGKGPEVHGVDYSLNDLRAHLERQFARGMKWENYAGKLAYRAKRSWVVDHIVPKRLFSADHVGEAYALTNLRPLWIKANLTKNAQRFHLL